MSKYFIIDDESYKKFQAALMLTGEEEDVVLRGLIEKYTHKVFASVMGKATEEKQDTNNQVNVENFINADEQKQLFINWFRSLTRNGKQYNPVTISGYAGRIENACKDPVFATVPVKNLFTITELDKFISIQKEIKACAGYEEFDARSHSGFTASLKKYEEFLKFQAGGSAVSIPFTEARSYYKSSTIHRWTMEEDEICCRRFLEYYVVKRSNLDTVSFLQMLAKEVPEVPEGSLRMKIQNIKYLTEQGGISDTSNFKCLSQHSMQCKKAFDKALKALNISV